MRKIAKICKINNEGHIFIQYDTVIDDEAVEERNGDFGSTNK